MASLLLVRQIRDDARNAGSLQGQVWRRRELREEFLWTY